MSTAHPFKGERRTLVKPFTDQKAKAMIQHDMLNSQKIGHEMILAYVPRFCSYEHPISSEKKRMKKKLLSLFSSESKSKRKSSPDKQQKELLDVMVAGVLKLSQGESDNSPLRSIVGSQITVTASSVE